MQITDLPPKIALAFAAHGSRNTIPLPSQIGTTPGAASLYDGFPPLTMTDPTAGGIAPDGRDFNGVLNLLSALLVWYSAGGTLLYDDAFSALISGYPKGCVLAVAGSPGSFWVSSIDNNTNNPDTGHLTGWSKVNMPAFTPIEQGGGPGQTTAKLNIGWTGSKLRLAEAGTDVDNIALEGWVNTAVSNAYNALSQAIVTEQTNRYNNDIAEQNSRSAGDTNITNWVSANFPTYASLNANFATNYSGSGYQKLWNGLILQWGRVSLATGGGDLIAFPIAFPHAILQIVASDWGSGVNVCAGIIYPPWAPSAFQAFSRDVNNPTVYKAGTAFGYFAVGY